ncbi:MAG: extracellular solute-binding protein [Demequina sp.]|nr:extracellular solute-binding protein [Demequina sp.]
MKHKIWGVAALAAATLLVTACSSTPDESGSSSAPSTPVEITFWHAYNADSQEVALLEDTLIPEFEAAHKDIKVKQVAVPYDDLHQKLVTAVAGGELPDVVRSDIIWVPELANLGVLEPLDTLMDDFGSIKDAVYPGPLDTGKWDGHYYGAPLATNTRVYLSNPDTYAKAGVEVPTTQQELVAVAPAIKKAGAYAFADNDLSGWNVLPWIWSAGGDLMDADLTTAQGYANSAASVSGVELLYNLYKDGYIPPIITQGGQDGTEDGLGSGEFASTLNGPWDFPIIAGSYPDLQLGSSQALSGAGGSISVVGGEDLVITAASEKKDAAAEWVRFLLSGGRAAPTCRRGTDVGSEVPGRRDGLNSALLRGVRDPARHGSATSGYARVERD